MNHDLPCEQTGKTPPRTVPWNHGYECTCSSDSKAKGQCNPRPVAVITSSSRNDVAGGAVHLEVCLFSMCQCHCLNINDLILRPQKDDGPLAFKWFSPVEILILNQICHKLDHKNLELFVTFFAFLLFPNWSSPNQKKAPTGHQATEFCATVSSCKPLSRASKTHGSPDDLAWDYPTISNQNQVVFFRENGSPWKKKRVFPKYIVFFHDFFQWRIGQISSKILPVNPKTCQVFGSPQMVWVACEYIEQFSTLLNLPIIHQLYFSITQVFGTVFGKFTHGWWVILYFPITQKKLNPSSNAFCNNRQAVTQVREAALAAPQCASSVKVMKESFPQTTSSPKTHFYLATCH